MQTLRIFVFATMLLSTMLAVVAHGQLQSIRSGGYDPVIHDGKSPAEAERQVIRLRRIRAVSFATTLICGVGLLRTLKAQKAR
jgi:hypothetical protein